MEPVMANARRLHWMLWSALLVSSALPLVVLSAFIPRGALDLVFFVTHPIGIAMLAFAGVNTLAAFLLPKVMLIRAGEVGLPPTVSEEISPREAQLLTLPLMTTWIVADFTGALGAVAAVMLNQWAVGIPFAALAIALMLGFAPTDDTLRRVRRG